MIAITSGSSSSSSSSSSSTTMSSSDFCVCAKDANPGATVLKNAFVKNGEFVPFALGRGLLTRGVFSFEDDTATCGAAEDSVPCGADEDLVTSGVTAVAVDCSAVEVFVEVDGSCLMGDNARGGAFVLTSSSTLNIVLQKKRKLAS